MALISVAVGAIAARFFGKKRDDADEDAQGDHPIVRAMFLAVNTGEDGDLRDLLHPELRLYMNDYPVPDPVRDHGPMLMLEEINDLRLNLPDIHWELYDELSGKDQGDDKIAFRFCSTCMMDGEQVEFSVAAFGVVQDDKLIELRQVGDLEMYEAHRAATVRPPLTPSDEEDGS